ncbi:hypothetical protein Aperf_G00000066208 [Anoplocephala perfoliata]
MSDHDVSRLSDEQLDCAFDFFLLYDQKLKQMENSLDDPEALRHILNDKQNDLQMAAQIGKSLLDRNRELDRRLRESENQVAAAMETINQLQYTLGMKEELLQMWNDRTADEEEEDFPTDDTCGIMDDSRSRTKNEIPSKTGAQASQEDIELIHRKLQALEEANASMRNTRQNEQQAAAMKECLRKLGDAVMYMKNLSEEHYRRSDALFQKQNQVNVLAARSRELENSLNQVGLTNEMLASKVEELNEVNQNLVRELRDMKDKYDESLTLYTQAQATVRKLRDRSRKAHLRPTCLLYSPLTEKSPSQLSSPNLDKPLSIADELANSSSKNQPLQSTSQPSAHQEQSLKPPNQTGADNESAEWDDPTLDSSGFVSSSEPIDPTHRVSRPLATTNPSATAAVLFDSQRLALQRGIDFDLDDPDVVGEGEEGVEYDDESSELIQAFADQHISLQPAITNRVLRRPNLSSPKNRQQSEHRQQQQQPMPITASSASRDISLKRRSWIIDQNTASKLPAQHSYDDNTCTDVNPSPLFSIPNVRPQRLQLVKQLQGSGVLQRWQRLATPSLTAALYERPLSGVASRAGVLPSEADSSASDMPISALSSHRWLSGFDLSQATHSSDDTEFVPISSRSLIQNSGGFEECTSSINSNITDKKLSEYLSRSAQLSGSMLMPAVVRPQPRSAKNANRESPTRFRVMSPGCRGLLEASALASEPITFDSAPIKILPPRPISPQIGEMGSGRGSPQHVSSVFRRQNVSRASPTLDSVQEESTTLPKC